MQMRRLGAVLVTAFLATTTAAVVQTTEVRGQQPPACIPGTEHVEMDFGAPDSNGVTRQDRLGSAGEKHGYFFNVPKLSSAFVYVVDQWYDLDLFLFRRGACAPGSWETLARAWSVNAERRTIQFVRPDEQIINLVPGEYLLIVGHKYAELPQFAADFDPNKGFTIRVATNPPVCGLAPPDVNAPNPFNPAVSMLTRPPDALYQLGLSIEPPNPGPFSLMSFTAAVSPPYTDLFDFAWTLDGQPVPSGSVTNIQSPTQALPKGTVGEHKVAVTARGARVYPDPEQPSIPLNGGTLTVECTFVVGST